MSWHASAWAARCRVGNPTRKLVLLACAENANPDGYSPVGYAYLANVSEASEKSVQRHLAALVEMGLIVRRRRVDQWGRQLGYDMWLQVQNEAYLQPTRKSPAAAPPEGETNCPPQATGGDQPHLGETNCPPQGTQSPPGGDTESTPSPTYSPIERETAHAHAREGEGESEQPLDAKRIRKILANRGFDWAEVMRTSTMRLTAEWVRAGLIESTLHEAIELAEHVQCGRPQSPAYYRWAVQRVLYGPKQESPQTGVAPAGSDQQQSGQRPPKESVHDLYSKEYASGASADDDIPEFLRGD